MSEYARLPHDPKLSQDAMDELDFRTAIFEAQDLGREAVKVEKWGLTIDVYELSGKERAQVVKQAQGEDKRVDMEKLYPLLLIATARYPQGHKRAGEPIFKPGDAGTLNTKSGAALEEVSQVAARLSKLTKEDIKEKKEK